MADQQSHTPTTGQVETGFALYLYDRENIVISSGRDRFKAWLAERDARIEAAAEQRGASKALRDAEEVIDAELQDSPAPNYEEDNYDAGRIDGLTFSQEHLRNRADQIEGDDA